MESMDSRRLVQQKQNEDQLLWTPWIPFMDSMDYVSQLQIYISFSHNPDIKFLFNIVYKNSKLLLFLHIIKFILIYIPFFSPLQDMLCV